MRDVFQKTNNNNGHIACNAVHVHVLHIIMNQNCGCAKSRCKTWPFSVRFAVFCRLKDGLLQRFSSISPIWHDYA